MSRVRAKAKVRVMVRVRVRWSSLQLYLGSRVCAPTKNGLPQPINYNFLTLTLTLIYHYRVSEVIQTPSKNVKT